MGKREGSQQRNWSGTIRAMVSRRTMLGGMIAAALKLPSTVQSHQGLFKDEAKFNELLTLAHEGDWKRLPIGITMGHVGLALRGTPYVGGTLDHDLNQEVCTVDLGHLDCVTFFEDTLDFSRMLLLGGHTESDMLKQVTLTRYRLGVNSGYTSRLHYTTDWIYDNAKKGVVIDLTSHLPGARPHHFRVDFMSTHADKYPELRANPNFVPMIQGFEERISKRANWIIPLDRVKEAEAELETGDIIGIGSSVPGLDIAHTGLIYVEDGIRHFLDATSVPSQMKVKLEGPLHQKLEKMRGATGIVVARPLSPVVYRTGPTKT